jgi:hypothetical protein
MKTWKAFIALLTMLRLEPRHGGGIQSVAPTRAKHKFFL